MLRLLRPRLTKTLRPLSWLSLRSRVPAPSSRHAVIDLTAEPSWAEIGDLAEDFDNKLELFMKFEDGSSDDERNWLTT